MGPVSAHSSQLCLARLPCYVAFHDLVSSRGPNFPPLYSHAKRNLFKQRFWSAPFHTHRKRFSAMLCKNFRKRVRLLQRTLNLALLSNTVSRYILFDPEKKRFLVFSKRDQRLAPLEKSHNVLRWKGAVNTRHMLTMGHVTDLTSWMLHFSWSYISIKITSLCLFRTTPFTYGRKIGTGLLSTLYIQKRAAINVSIPFIFWGDCARRYAPSTPFNSCRWWW